MTPEEQRIFQLKLIHLSDQFSNVLDNTEGELKTMFFVITDYDWGGMEIKAFNEKEKAIEYFNKQGKEQDEGENSGVVIIIGQIIENYGIDVNEN